MAKRSDMKVEKRMKSYSLLDVLVLLILILRTTKIVE